MKNLNEIDYHFMPEVLECQMRDIYLDAGIDSFHDLKKNHFYFIPATRTPLSHGGIPDGRAHCVSHW